MGLFKTKDSKAVVRLLQCDALLTRHGWLEQAFVALDDQGCVVAISPGKPPIAAAASSIERIPGLVIPGFQNSHSHAFQYAMAGLTEHRGGVGGDDDFWSWREAMYQLANSVTPERLQAVAAMLYAEMLRHGITAVAEFHYLHHDHSGAAYSDLGEMSRRLLAAAEQAGIAMTLIPVFYQRGGFGKDASAQQRRFLSKSPDAYLRLVEAVSKAAQGYRDACLGMALHSLRAVESAAVQEVCADSKKLPIHIHVAEQQAEVEDCLRHLRQRPVDWLLDHVDVDERFSLVHATHITPAELRRTAASGAVVVVCPATEGNLGDGFFPLRDYLSAGGKLAIGTDSHISLSPLEDLRWLDYGQRLQLQKRNTLCTAAGDDSAHLLFEKTWLGGKQALGHESKEFFASGSPFDAVVVNPNHPLLIGKKSEHRLASAIFGGDPTIFSGTLRRGHWLVRDGRHKDLESLVTAYRKT